MITITALELRDFGPFKDRQRLEVARDGLTIVYGENGTGKTILLNAIRYALFGHVLGRGSTVQDLSGLANWEGCAGRPPEFMVVLELDSDGTRYRLTRRFGPDARTNELATAVSLVKNGSPLGPDEAAAELVRLIPETISRFFLFDGELLQQYEELLRSDSEIGEKIKESIERILGVPILTSSRADVASLLREANKEVARSAERDVRTRQVGQALLQAQNRLEAVEANAADLELQLKRLEDQRAELEAQLARFERTGRLLEQRDHVRTEIRSLESSRTEAEVMLSSMAPMLWQPAVAPRLREHAGQMALEIAKLDQQYSAAVLSRALLKAVQEASGQCPTCGRVMDEAHKSELIARFSAEMAGVEESERTLRAARSRYEVLINLEQRADEAKLQRLLDQIDDANAMLAEKRDRLTVLEEQLRSVPEADIRALGTQLGLVGASEANTRDRLAGQRREAGELGELVARLRTQLEQAGTGADEIVHRRAQLLAQLDDLFNAAIGEYRNRLRHQVEQHASAVFRNLSHQREYEQLRINEQYGLTIVHRDGSEIPSRSAGFEHLVALALIAALQQCAPITGPIIMDSPFGRLDEAHKRNVVSALPQMAKQVVLLVYEKELDRAMVISALGRSLRKEFFLNQLTARHTELQERVGV